VLGDGGDEDGGDDDGGVGVFDAASGAGAGSGAGTGSGAGAGTGSGLGGGGSLCTAAVLAAVVGGVVMAGAEGGAVVGTGFVSDCAGLSVSFITAVTDPKPTRSAATHASGSKTARVPILEAKERPPSRSAAGSIDSRGGPSPCRSGALSRSAGGSVGEPSGSCGAIGAVASFPGATFRLTCEIATIALSPTASVVKPIVGPLFTQISVVKVVPSGSPREESFPPIPQSPLLSRFGARGGPEEPESRTEVEQEDQTCASAVVVAASRCAVGLRSGLSMTLIAGVRAAAASVATSEAPRCRRRPRSAAEQASQLETEAPTWFDDDASRVGELEGPMSERPESCSGRWSWRTRLSAGRLSQRITPAVSGVHRNAASSAWGG
jgi:hypothetical protein